MVEIKYIKFHSLAPIVIPPPSCVIMIVVAFAVVGFCLCDTFAAFMDLPDIYSHVAHSFFRTRVRHLIHKSKNLGTPWK